MELKKNPKYDISKKSSLYRNIGMSISLLLVIFAFEWKSYDELAVIVGGDIEVFDEYLPPVTTQEVPPPPPKIEAPVPIEVIEEPLDNIEVIIDTETTDIEDIPDVIIETPEIIEDVEEAPLVFAEERAEFEGGLQEFYKYLGKHIKYPRKAQRLGIEGRVYLQFIVEKDGSLTDIQVVKGIGAGCDEEAVRVLQNSPKWKPAKQRGKKVRFKMTQPISFKLNR